MTAPTPTQRYASGMRGFAPGDARREAHDFYPTPPAVTLALLAAERFDGAIWEPACGDGAMADVLAAAGHRIVATDLIDRGYGEGGRDFLEERTSLAPNIVTNPPFRDAVRFVEHALELTTGKVALLLRLAFLEGRARGTMFRNTPLARVHVFSNRISFRKAALADRGASGGMVAFAWYVWEHGHVGAAALNWIETPAEPRAPRLDLAA